MKASDPRGSVQEFDTNWRLRREAKNTYWTKGRPSNQIQLAFQSHWRLFSELLGDRGGRCLEVGCGRGSISSYFAENGYDCTLLDYSISVLETAKEIFDNNGHQAIFVAGDANQLPFVDESFNVVVSIGLLEHFQDINTVLAEQVRILRPGGMFLGYIVPEQPENVQRHYRLVNTILKSAGRLFGPAKAPGVQKAQVYRSDFGSPRYLAVLEEQPVCDVQVMGVYPLPMISHSPEFPFSLLPKPLERVLTLIFEAVLWLRRRLYGRNPWICDEAFGQSFLVTCKRH